MNGRNLLPQRLIEWTGSLGRKPAAALVAGSFVLLSAAAMFAGPSYSFAALFMLPIALSAWTLGLRAGFATGLVGAAVQALIAGHSATFNPGAAVSTLAGAWNFGMRCLAVAILVFLVDGFRRSYDEQSRRARTDPLTGALNRCAFDERVETTLAIARRHGLAVVLAYADLDDFKQVNDRHGHAAGDRVLQAFVAAAHRVLRSTDAVARIGGDEFLFLMPVRSLERGYSLISRLHGGLVGAIAAEGVGAGCSLGAVVMESGGGDEATLVELADSLMYEVKRSGKGAFRIATLTGTSGGKPADAGGERARAGQPLRIAR